MPPLLFLLLLFSALLGHAVLWVGLVNRIHGIGIRRWLVDGITLLSGLALVGVPVLIAGRVLLQGALLPDLFGLAGLFGLEELADGVSQGWLVQRYGELCVLLFLATCCRRFFLWFHSERRGCLLSFSSKTRDLAQEHGETLAASGAARWLSRLPGNELLKPQLTQKELLTPGLPHALDGLRIAHLSDLHMSGRVAVEYFQEIVQWTNDQSPDLIALTGDLVEFNPQLQWIETTLAKLEAKHGVYFVRGNHDDKCDHARMRAMLRDAGHNDLAHTWVDRVIRGCRVRFVGNELPWFAPAGDPNGDGGHRDYTIALAHGPDQFHWGAQHGVGLLLAGHNHGGQIRVPLLGALVTPSIHGVRYNSGVFRQGQTVMHVSRGAGSLAPLRYNCPPEVAVLTLRATGQATPSDAS